jgi:hypothetical protein
MNEVVVVPDVHGRTFWKPLMEYGGEIIFLGDYTDPYPTEEISPADAFEGFTEIVALKKQYPDRVTLLIGNHELHYYDRSYMCSRFCAEYYDEIHDILTGDTKELFQLCKQTGKYLFIHAGITRGWYRRYKDTFSTLGDTLEEQLNRFFSLDKEAFYEVSATYRGGLHENGSPLWADIFEHLSEEAPFDEQLVQVIGHTQISREEPFVWKHIRLLDNRKLYLLSDDKLTIYLSTPGS